MRIRPLPGQWLAFRHAALNPPIGIGTQASQYLFQELRRRGWLSSRRFVFAGVSDPLDAVLVYSLRNRHDDRLVAGVMYGEGPEPLVSIVRWVFPQNPLVFLYTDDEKNFPQDVTYAWRLGRNALAKETIEGRNVPRLRVQKTAGFGVQRGDLSERDAVYFGWYTFETTLEERQETGTPQVIARSLARWWTSSEVGQAIDR